MVTECPVARHRFPTGVGLSRFVCSLCVAAVVVIRDHVLSFYHRMEGVSRLVVHVHVV